MIFYEADVKKAVARHKVPKSVFVQMNNAFIALSVTLDLSLFDIKKLQSPKKRTYYRLRKGKYRAIFYIDGADFYVISIAKREEVYRRWE
jgi:mRNA interferase RelE/StbE